MSLEGENEQVSTDENASGNSSESQSETAGAEGTQQTKETPFHEHPRFKELVEQKNQFATQLQERSTRYERELSELKGQLEKLNTPKTPEAKNALIERLKGIDPEFGAWAEKQEATAKELQELRDWKAQTSQTTQQQTVNSELDKLHAEHKVPKELQGMYKAQIAEMARANPNLKMQDLPVVYKQLHNQINKYLDNRDKEKLAGYTKSKTADSNIPTGAQRGVAPTPNGKKPEWSKDPEEARGQLVSRIMNKVRAGNEA